MRDDESPVIAILCYQGIHTHTFIMRTPLLDRPTHYEVQIVCVVSAGSKEVEEYQQILKKAINEVHDTRERLLSFIVETEDIQDVKMLGVNKLIT